MNIIQSVKYEKVERSKGDEVRSLSGYPRKELSQGNSNIAATQNMTMVLATSVGPKQ